MSMIRKYLGDPYRITPIEDVQITKDSYYEKISVSILDHQVCKLRSKEVTSIKVLWRKNNVEEMTWEAEEDMKYKYPNLFHTMGDNVGTTIAGTTQDTTEDDCDSTFDDEC